MDSSTLADWALVAVYTTGVILVLAFVANTIDLASRAAHDPDSWTSRARGVGYSLTWLGFLVSLGATVARGLAAQRVPWSNMYEFSTTAVTIILGVFLVATLFVDIRFLGTYITGFCVLVLVLATTIWWTGVKPLQPALQSPWIVIHVLVAILGTGFFALAAALSGLQLAQARREGRPEAERRPNRVLDRLPPSKRLEGLAYQTAIIGFVLWTFTLIFGAIWAQKAWGRYWGWDVKETWTFIIWVLYAGYIHARATQGWRGARAAVLNLVGFAAILFNFGVVNTLFKGLHAYSGL